MAELDLNLDYFINCQKENIITYISIVFSILFIALINLII